MNIKERIEDLLHIRKLDKYIIQKFLGTFLYTVAIFIAIAIVFDYAEKVDNFLEHNLSARTIIFDYYIHFVPYYIGMLSPLLIFIAVIYFTSRMANQTEIVAILSNGVSFKRFLYPYLLASAFLALISFVANSYVIPNSNKKRVAFEDKYIFKPKNFKDHHIHMQLNNTTFIYMESFFNDENTGYRFSMEKFKNKELTYKLISDRIKYDTLRHNWRIENYTIRYINGLHERFEKGTSKDTVLELSPSDFIQRELSDANMLTNGELDDIIAKEKFRGTDRSGQYVIEKYKRFAMPFSTFILVLIGVALSSRKVRGGAGANIGIGIGSSFAYIVLLQFTSTFAIKGDFPPLLAVWIPNLLFGLYATFLIRIAPK